MRYGEHTMGVAMETVQRGVGRQHEDVVDRDNMEHDV